MRRRIRNSFIVPCIIAFVVTMSLGSTASLLVAISSTGPPASGITVANSYAAPGVILEWPAKTPGAVQWPAPTEVQSARSFGSLSFQAYWQSGLSKMTHRMTVARFGWPTPVLERVQVWWPREDPAYKSDPAYSNPQTPDSGFRVLWWSLATQSAGIGVVGASAVAAVLWIIAWRRSAKARRGECLACGHLLAGLPQCPECGTAV